MILPIPAEMRFKNNCGRHGAGADRIEDAGQHLDLVTLDIHADEVRRAEALGKQRYGHCLHRTVAPVRVSEPEPVG